MTSYTGTYFDGKIKLDKPFHTKVPLRVTVLFDEEKSIPLSIRDFSFVESQNLLKNIKSSFSDEVIEERRKAL